MQPFCRPWKYLPVLPASLPAMEEAAVNRLATSITRLTLSQVTTDEIDAATKLLDGACQKLRGIPDVPPQRIETATHHGWTHTIEVLDSAGLPTRHDGAHRHGSGDCNDCLWHPRPQKRCHHLGLAYFQCQSGAGKP